MHEPELAFKINFFSTRQGAALWTNKYIVEIQLDFVLNPHNFIAFPVSSDSSMTTNRKTICQGLKLPLVPYIDLSGPIQSRHIVLN